MCPWLTECFCPQAAATSKLLRDDGDLAEIGIASSKTIEESLKTDTGSGNGSSYKIKQLFNRHGYNLAILQGHVRGRVIKSHNALCVISARPPPFCIRIRPTGGPFEEMSLLTYDLTHKGF